MAENDDLLDFDDIAEIAAKAETGAMRILLPGRVLTYEHEPVPKARVQCTLRFRRIKDGEVVSYLPDPVDNVPIHFPQGGGGALTFKLVPGDYVDLQVADRSLDEWLATANTDIEPADTRRFDLTDCIAYPGTRPHADPLPADALSGAAAVLSWDLVRVGGASAQNAVAIATAVESYLTTFINTRYNTHTHTSPAGGSTGPPNAPGTPPTAGEFDASKLQTE